MTDKDHNLISIVARLEEKVSSLEEDTIEIKKDVREIRDTISGVRGSWKVLLAIAAIISGLLVSIGTKILEKFF